MRDKQGRELFSAPCICGKPRLVRWEKIEKSCISCTKAQGKGFPAGVRVDSEFEHLTKWSWRIINSGYVYHTVKGLLHRLVTNCPVGMEVDHLDNDKLNCLKENLEIVTPKENARRREMRKKVYVTRKA